MRGDKTTTVAIKKHDSMVTRLKTLFQNVGRLVTAVRMSYLHVPLLAHGVDHAAFNGSPAGPTDGHAHLVVTGQAVELSLQFPGIRCQLLATGMETENGQTLQHTITIHEVIKTWGQIGRASCRERV